MSVLDNYDLVAGVYVARAAALPLRAYAFSVADTHLSTARTYALTGGASALADATTATGVDLNSLLVWGTANPSATTNWVDDNGGVTTLTGAQCVELANAVMAYAQIVYGVLATTMSAITAGTITTQAQIDEAAWPSP